MHSDITAVCFKGANGFLSIFNIYNEINNNDTLACLDSFSDLNTHIIQPAVSDRILWLGDFNRHHPMWEEDSNKQLFEPDETITPLIDLLYKNNMVLALPKGIPMLQTSAGNWMKPDNVWCSSSIDDPIQWCNTVLAIWPPLANHMPIITILNLPFPRSSATKSLNFRLAEWSEISAVLKQHLEVESPVSHIGLKEVFIKKVDDLVHIISEVLEEHLEERTPNPFKQRWWTKELSLLKKAKNRLSNKSFKFWHLRDHHIHAEYRMATNKFKEVMHEMWDQDWKDWLKSASQQDLYITNKYISSEPSDHSNARIPTLHTSPNGLPNLDKSNSDKGPALADSFFPPPLVRCQVPPNQTYPTPLQGPHFFSRSWCKFSKLFTLTGYWAIIV